MESQGKLRDMWNAMMSLQKSKPDLILSVKWYTFGDGFKSDTEPKLIGLEPFDETTAKEMTSEIKNWPYYDIESKIPRGILITRMVVKYKSIYILEIQRRPKLSKDKKEEQFRGMAFVLDKPGQLDEWIRQLKSEMRHIKGVIQKLEGDCPGKAISFNHRLAENEKFPCEAALNNALMKIGAYA